MGLLKIFSISKFVPDVEKMRAKVILNCLLHRHHTSISESHSIGELPSTLDDRSDIAQVQADAMRHTIQSMS